MSLSAVKYRPGAIYTPIQADTREAKQMESWGGKTGLGRPGEPSEVATTFVFLASAEASLYCKCSDPRNSSGFCHFVERLIMTFEHRWTGNALLPTG